LSGFTASWTKKAHSIVDSLIEQMAHSIVDSFARMPVNKGFHAHSTRPYIGSYE
jgi:hypothetical protein